MSTSRHTITSITTNLHPTPCWQQPSFDDEGPLRRSQTHLRLRPRPPTTRSAILTRRTALAGLTRERTAKAAFSSRNGRHSRLLCTLPQAKYKVPTAGCLLTCTRLLISRRPTPR
ncbi:unnamed protein product [Ectocarpus fasciculatus]